MKDKDKPTEARIDWLRFADVKARDRSEMMTKVPLPSSEGVVRHKKEKKI